METSNRALQTELDAACAEENKEALQSRIAQLESELEAGRLVTLYRAQEDTRRAERATGEERERRTQLETLLQAERIRLQTSQEELRKVEAEARRLREELGTVSQQLSAAESRLNASTNINDSTTGATGQDITAEGGVVAVASAVADRGEAEAQGEAEATGRGGGTGEAQQTGRGRGRADMAVEYGAGTGAGPGAGTESQTQGTQTQTAVADPHTHPATPRPPQRLSPRAAPVMSATPETGRLRRRGATEADEALQSSPTKRTR